MSGHPHIYSTYIMSNRIGSVLYVGVTNDLMRRVHEHKSHAIRGFTSRYNVDRLVHHEETHRIEDAIAREKQLKKWSRSKKCQLIERENPDWNDLSARW